MASRKKTPFLADGKTKKPAAPSPKMYQALEVKISGSHGSSFRISSPRFAEGKTFPRDYFYDNAKTQALAILKYNKWNIAGYAEYKNGWIVFTNTFESPKMLNKF